MSQPIPVSTAHRIPSLDGLRALSIIFVIVGHAVALRIGDVPDIHHPFGLILGNGPFGVSVFFVISGFLITGLLLRELDASGDISLRTFYWRRTFRILPALWVYLAAVAALGAAHVISVSPREWLSSVTFTKDYTPWLDTWSLRHMWSLSVEEQFYLLWPAALLLAGRKRGTYIAAAIIVVSPVIRVIHYALFGGIQPGLWEMLHTRADALMFGCLAALQYDSEKFRGVCRKLFPAAPFMALFVVFVAPILTARFRGSYLYTVGYTLEGVTILLCMLWVIDNPLGVVGRILNSRPIAHLGVISYSLYLWQQLCLDPAYAAGHLPLAIVAMLLAAEASYWLPERAGLRWRKRLEARRPSAISAPAIVS